MATCGIRLCAGNIQQPAIAFLLGMGILSIFYSFIMISIVAPAYNLRYQSTLDFIYNEESLYDKNNVNSKKRRNISRPRGGNYADENEVTFEEVVLPDENISDHERVLKIVNESGRPWHDFKYLRERLENETYISGELPVQVLKRMSDEVSMLETWLKEPRPKPANYDKRVTIYVATIVCGSRRQEAGIMLKSLLVFSQDANLHLIVFSDNNTIVDVGQDLLAVKWLAQRKLGFDFSFELHMEYFPDDKETNWRYMYRVCATQRLFFPGLLAHIDSLIYLDTDIIVVSNMTQFWEHFTVHMDKDQMVAVAQNNEESANGWYGSWLKIPYVGKKGLNAGVMLMNLTRLRNFKFEQRAIASNRLFKERIKLADQDIINIVFSGYPEYVYPLNCTYNFNWIHCGSSGYKCINDKGENPCFCKAALHQGIRVVHGNSGTFSSEDKELIFINHLYKAFNMFNLVTDSAGTLFNHLIAKFAELPRKPCAPLNSSILYDNADKYLRNLEKLEL